jgi:hypothetical protein
MSFTKSTISEDYKSIITKEMSQYKVDATQARSDLSTTLKLEITTLVNQTIQQSCKGIIQEVHSQSTMAFLTTAE